MPIFTLQTQLVSNQNKRGPSDCVTDDAMSPSKEIPAKPTEDQVIYMGPFSIKYCKHAFDKAHACKYALCPKCHMGKLTEDNVLTRRTAKRSRRGVWLPTDNDCKVHQVMDPKETTEKSYLPRNQNDLNENHTLLERCFGCGYIF